MHVPISHATLQCSTPPLRLHAPSTQSIIPEYGGLKAMSGSSLSKGMGWRGGGQKISQKGSKKAGVTPRKRGDRGDVQETGQGTLSRMVWCTGGLQRATPILLLHLHLCAAPWNCYFIACLKMVLKHSFVFNFLQAFHPPSPCHHCMLFSHELNSASPSDIHLPFLLLYFIPRLLVYFPLSPHSHFLAHFVLSTS